jgi:Protein of unknown function (DUF2752)
MPKPAHMRFSASWRGFFLLSFLLLAVLPTRLIDRLPPVCPYRKLFGIRCLGCGMTHAVSLLLHFRGADAMARNPLVVIVCPWLAAMAARDLLDLRRVLLSSPRRSRSQAVN